MHSYVHPTKAYSIMSTATKVPSSKWNFTVQLQFMVLCEQYKDMEGRGCQARCCLLFVTLKCLSTNSFTSSRTLGFMRLRLY